MSGRVGSWQCRSCGVALATVADGCLYPRSDVLARVDGDGKAVLVCPNDACRRPRIWWPRSRRVANVVR